MDGVRFDYLVRSLTSGVQSRRRLLQVLLGASVAAVVGSQLSNEVHAVCRQKGARCKLRQHQQCCSGTCKPKKRRNGKKRQGKCRPTRGAQGCTINPDFCQGIVVPCPGNSEGTCYVLNNGKPVCALGGGCFECQSDADCTQLAGGVPGRCITNCPECPESGNTACVFTTPIVT